MPSINKLLVSLALCQAAAAAVGQTATSQATGSATASAASYRCGGVGSDESEAMKAAAGQHGLFLVFSATTGAYVADVDVEISRAGGGTVLQARCGGPMMLVDVADKGNYQVKASYAGRTQSKTVTLGAAPARASFVWPADSGSGPDILR